MPKRISRDQQVIWQQEFQQGLTIAQMAKKHGKDPRTVQRAVEEAERLLVTKQARTDLLKEGLQRHQEELLALLRNAADATEPIPSVVDLRFPGVQPPEKLIMHRWTASYREQEGGYKEIQLEVEEGFRWKLVLAHLGRDPALKALSGWKEAVLAELNQRLLLREFVAEHVAGELKLQASDDIRESGTIRPSVLWEFYQEVLFILAGEERAGSLVVSQGDDEHFPINGSAGGRLPGNSQYFEALQQLPGVIAAAQPAIMLREFQLETQKRATLVREKFLEIAESFYLTGACRSCRRYGT